MSALNYCEAPTRSEKSNRVVRPWSKCLMPLVIVLAAMEEKEGRGRGPAGTVLDSARPVLL